MGQGKHRSLARQHGRAPLLASTGAVQALAQEIAARFHPTRVVLFGSYALGTAGPDSDVDLLVVMPTPLRPIQQAALISQAVEHRFPLDIVVKTPEQIGEAFRTGNQFLQEVLATGITLYEAADSRLGQ